MWRGINRLAALCTTVFVGYLVWQMFTEPGWDRKLAISIIAAICVWLIYELITAPLCTCNRPDCGGGCGLR